jgi:hypothetical protein
MARTTEENLDLSTVRRVVDQWYALKRQAATLGVKVEAEKSRLKKIVERYGTTDPTTGSIFLELEEPVGDKSIFTLRNQCRTSTSLNAEKAERILRRKGIWKDMVRVIEVPDTDKIHAAFYDKLITQDELDQMFPKSTMYAFTVLDDNGKPVS